MKARILIGLFLVLSVFVSVGGVSSQGIDDVEVATAQKPEEPQTNTWGDDASGSTAFGLRRIRLATATLGDTNYGVWSQSNDESGRGVLGYATAISGTTYGVWGQSASTSGTGVYGSGVRYGIQAYASSTSADAVLARATATSGPAWAINAYTASPTGWSGVFYSAGNGVYAQSASTSGRGVLGYATATSGTTYGVWGQSASTSGTGVYGSGVRYGIQGYASSTVGDAVLARATATSGPAWAINAYTASPNGWSGVFTSAGNGVYAQSASTSGQGVLGYATAISGTTYGVWGQSASTSGTGVYGNGVRFGLQGYASSVAGDAVLARATATSGPAWAINAYTASPDGWSGVFNSAGNGVFISTPSTKTGLTVVGGSKNAAVNTADGSRLLYSEEATEVWFADYGFGKLQGGRAVISIDPLFAQTVNLNESYHVFLQAYGDAEIYVSERTPTHFEVRASRGRNGDPNVEFSYRLVARRVGFETQRLALAPWMGDDASLLAQKIVGPAAQLEALDLALKLELGPPNLELGPMSDPLSEKLEGVRPQEIEGLSPN